jgi:propanol-preferring alcohol dehydrogenase
VINAIQKARPDQSELLRIDYATHLWMEREVKSVANVTRADVRDILNAAVTMGLRPTVTEVPFERANDVLAALRGGASVRGASVLRGANSDSSTMNAEGRRLTGQIEARQMSSR